ncbi:phosphopantetheine-binding protein [Streptomyces sp. WI04-05B]|uniref:phosphopantetheine-binding protein n=1 Tax=Streptomyces TaxID=1883 RepID=UPI0029A3BA0D|nr:MULTISPECIES: phosphopantetheine-binding protein [unclassified Streptomyces]MDX2547307.1 phosphopantetheine-binding protein [Streptomyces sp. WI04-05B]MDX2589795.1 phosphopantetheine-binding protein [Streptomyces sp. WI04-05A]MDX3753467.1 phosphopantetheine-binding protein [Streptomyces sp. AK08-02]
MIGHNEEIARRVREIMVDVLDLRLSPAEIRDDISLYSPTIRLDSLNLLQLLMAVEAEFGGHIEDEDIMEADLENVGDLITLISRKMQTAAVRDGAV